MPLTQFVLLLFSNRFKEFIRSHSPRKTLSLDEFLKHRTEYVSNKENGDVSTENGVEGIPGIEALPGEDGPPGEEVEMVEEGDSKEKEDLPPGIELAPPGEDDKEKEELVRNSSWDVFLLFVSIIID